MELPKVLLGAAAMSLAAAAGGELFERRKQPAVLGELAAGIVLGNLALFGVSGLDWLKSNEGLHLLAEVGVILLLFEVGLESRIDQLLAVGWSAALVAHIGVLIPFGLGWAVSAAFLPSAAWYTHMFVGATLTATSVGITARVIKDLGRMEAPESRIILGAAVVDDVLGLIILAVAAGMTQSAAKGGGASMDWTLVGGIVAKAAAFLVGAIVLGRLIHVNALRLAESFHSRGVTLVLALSFCFALSALAGMMGLAPIVGAFAAGLVLEDDDYAVFERRGFAPVHDMVRPIAAVLVPLFFVMMGLRADLRSFASWNVIGLALAVTVAAVAGKQACALGVLDKGVSRLTVGIGMIPRGEVGLIFAGMGASLTVAGQPVFDGAVMSAMIVMVLLTTLVTPPLLLWAFRRG